MTDKEFIQETRRVLIAVILIALLLFIGKKAWGENPCPECEHGCVITGQACTLAACFETDQYGNEHSTSCPNSCHDVYSCRQANALERIAAGMEKI